MRRYYRRYYLVSGAPGSRRAPTRPLAPPLVMFVNERTGRQARLAYTGEARFREGEIVQTIRHSLVTPTHATSYLEAVPENGPLLVFVHGWPGLPGRPRAAHHLGSAHRRGLRTQSPRGPRPGPDRRGGAAGMYTPPNLISVGQCGDFHVLLGSVCVVMSGGASPRTWWIRE